jgi:hypothetical protein
MGQMNGDLISRSALLERLAFKRMGSMERNTYPGLESAIAQVKKAPAVDAVEVVRCKDCERRDKTADLTNDILCPYMEAIMPKNAFCSYGERRGDE